PFKSTQSAIKEMVYRSINDSGDRIQCAAFSPDGSMIVTGGDYRVIRFWDVSSGAETRNFVAHNGLIVAVAFSPDGKIIVSGSEDKSAIFWDVTTCQAINRFNYPEWVEKIAFSSDGGRILLGIRDRTARVLDVASGQVISNIEWPTEYIY